MKRGIAWRSGRRLGRVHSVHESPGIQDFRRIKTLFQRPHDGDAGAGFSPNVVAAEAFVGRGGKDNDRAAEFGDGRTQHVAQQAPPRRPDREDAARGSRRLPAWACTQHSGSSDRTRPINATSATGQGR